MSHSKKKRREHKKQGRFNLFPPDASLGIIGGFLLAYLILVGHPFSHPRHWAYSVVGGVVGYAFVLLWTYRPSWMRPMNGQRLWLNHGVASLLAALFIVSFVILGYVLP